MSGPGAPKVVPMPSGVFLSIVIGISAAAVGWWLTGWLPTFTTSYTRLDQLTALALGATVGGAIAAGREFRQRRRVVPGLIAGALLGGVGALAGVSLTVFGHGAIGPREFLAARVMTWALLAAGCSALIGWLVVGYRGRLLAESALIASVGGAIGGLIFTLPGAADVWQAVAMLWLGGIIGVATAGPELWHAVAVIELVPTRDERWHPLRLREWPLAGAAALALGEAQAACHDDRIAFYPPAGGALAEGHTLRSPRFLASSIVIAVGRNRYRFQLLRSR